MLEHKLEDIRSLFKRRKLNKITVLSLLLISINIYLNFVFLVNGRPTADEYLIAPLLHGFYVDAPNSNGLLFNPSDNLLFNFAQAVMAAFKLGWDAPLNFAIFQMFPATILNYSGPISTKILFVFNSLILFFCGRSIVKIIFDSRKTQMVIFLAFLFSFYSAVISANFGDLHKYFGIFTLTGIRFSSYWVHPVIIFSLFLYSLQRLLFKKQFNWTDLVIFILIPNLVSFWSITYWISLWIITFFIVSIKKYKLHRQIVAGLFFTFVFSILYLESIINPQIKAGRSILESSDLQITENVSFMQKFLSLKNPIFRSDFWSVSFGMPALIGLMSGILCSLVYANLYRKNFDETQDKSNTHKFLYILRTILFINLLMMPFIFRIQEYFTYIAWWHRTTPAVISFLSLFVLGVENGIKLRSRSKLRPLKKYFYVLSIFLATISCANTFNSKNELVSFSKEWDSGNLLGIGSPVANSSTYNVREIQRIKPYRFPNANLLNLMSESIKFEIMDYERTGDRRIEILVEDSPFKAELGGITYITISNPYDSDSKSTYLKDSSDGSIYGLSSNMDFVNVKVEIGKSNKFNLIEIRK